MEFAKSEKIESPTMDFQKADGSGLKADA